MNLETEITASAKEERGSLLSLALLSLLAGAASGLVGAVFRLSLDLADRLRGALISWAHGEKVCGFFARHHNLCGCDRCCSLVGSTILAAGLRQRHPPCGGGPERSACRRHRID